MPDREQLRYCPECHCWSVHHPGCPEGDNGEAEADEEWERGETEHQLEEMDSWQSD